MSALALCVAVLLSAEADPLKAARTAFGEGDSDGCLKVVDQVLATRPAPPMLARVQFLRAQCLNLKDGPSPAVQALEAALDADPEMVIDASRVDPQLVGLFEGVKQRSKADVAVSSDKPDTVVVLDGAEVGLAPISLKAVPGRHRLVARTRDGRFSKDKEFVAHPKRSYEFAFELAAAGTSAGPVPDGALSAPPPPPAPATWVNGLFADVRVLGDPGRGVGFEAGLGWAGDHVAASLHFVRGGFPGASARVAARLPVAGDRVVLGAGVEGVAFFIPTEAAGAGGVAPGVAGHLSAAVRSGVLEPFVEVGGQSVFSSPAVASVVPRFSPVLTLGLRLFVP